MNKIIVSINPRHVNNIINGSKRYEYRTRIASKGVNKLLIYETAPIKKVVAEVDVIEVLSLDPNTLWEQTKDYSGISKKFFDEYFKNRSVAYAYKLGKVKVYDEPKSLIEFGLRTAPQSFAYAR